MDEHNLLKYGFVALLAVALLVVVGLALQSDDIEDQAWAVEELSVGGTMTPPISGTTPLVLFEGGSVNGTAGCNSFFGSYETDGDSISIGPLGSTLAFCSEPEGVMDQEQALLAALQQADAFDVSGDTLTLSDGSGALVVLTATDMDMEG